MVESFIYYSVRLHKELDIQIKKAHLVPNFTNNYKESNNQKAQAKQNECELGLSVQHPQSFLAALCIVWLKLAQKIPNTVYSDIT